MGNLAAIIPIRHARLDIMAGSIAVASSIVAVWFVAVAFTAADPYIEAVESE
jgi:hypothetical protein